MECSFCGGHGWCWAWSPFAWGWEREPCPDCDGTGEAADPWALWLDLGNSGGR